MLGEVSLSFPHRVNLADVGLEAALLIPASWPFLAVVPQYCWLQNYSLLGLKRASEKVYAAFKTSLHFLRLLQLICGGRLQCWVEKDSEAHEQRVLSLISDVCHGHENG